MIPACKGGRWLVMFAEGKISSTFRSHCLCNRVRGTLANCSHLPIQSVQEFLNQVTCPPWFPAGFVDAWKKSVSWEALRFPVLHDCGHLKFSATSALQQKNMVILFLLFVFPLNLKLFSGCSLIKVPASPALKMFFGSYSSSSEGRSAIQSVTEPLSTVFSSSEIVLWTRPCWALKPATRGSKIGDPNATVSAFSSNAISSTLTPAVHTCLNYFTRILSNRACFLPFVSFTSPPKCNMFFRICWLLGRMMFSVDIVKLGRFSGFHKKTKCPTRGENILPDRTFCKWKKSGHAYIGQESFFNVSKAALARHTFLRTGGRCSLCNGVVATTYWSVAAHMGHREGTGLQSLRSTVQSGDMAEYPFVVFTKGNSSLQSTLFFRGATIDSS